MLYQAKTDTPVFVPLAPHVVELLRSVPLGLAPNPNYFFWPGNGLPKTYVANWQRTYRLLFAIANMQSDLSALVPAQQPGQPDGQTEQPVRGDAARSLPALESPSCRYRMRGKLHPSRSGSARIWAQPNITPQMVQTSWPMGSRHIADEAGVPQQS